MREAVQSTVYSVQYTPFLCTLCLVQLCRIPMYTVYSSAVHEYSTERQLRPAVAQVHRPASRAPAAGEGGGCCAVQCSAVVEVALASEGGFLSEVWE